MIHYHIHRICADSNSISGLTSSLLSLKRQVQLENSQGQIHASIMLAPTILTKYSKYNFLVISL